MTLIIQKPTGAKLNLRKTWQPMDPDAAAYITAVETADGQALEEKTKIAIDNFVLGCKADGIWSAIKASCILAGARTLSGALVPLVGTAPTSYNYVAADYNRKTGLNSDGTKYLDANRDNSLDPQNNRHFAFMPTSIPGSRDLIDVVGFLSGGRNLYTSGQGGRVAISSSLSVAGIGLPVVNTLLGASRFNGTSSVFRTNRLSTVLQVPSLTPSVGELRLSVNWNARLAFYSIGESLDLAKLDARVTDLINAFGVAIP